MQKKINRRQLLRGAATLGLGAVGAQILAACAPPPAAPAGQAAPAAAPAATDAKAAPAATNVALRVQASVVPLGEMAIEFAKRFEADTGIKVTVEETIYAEIEQKTQTGFISNTLQDVVYGHHRWLFINFSKGIYLPIDDMLKSNPPPDYADIFPSVMAGNQFDGKNFSLPDVTHPGGNIAVSYNKDILKAKGLAEPKAGWSMTDWEELARAATEKDKVFGMGFDSLNALHYYSNVARSFGPKEGSDTSVMDKEGKKFQFNTPAHKEIGDWLSKLFADRVIPRAADYIEKSAGNIFKAGLSATHASIVGGVADFIKAAQGKFEMDAVMLPVGPKGRQGTCYSGNQWMINAKTQFPAEAYKLMTYYTSKDAGVFLAVKSRVQPNGRKSAWMDKDVNAINKMFGVAVGLIEAGVEPFPMPNNTRFSEANTTFQNEIDQIWEGTKSWDEQAPVVQDKVQKVLDLGRP